MRDGFCTYNPIVLLVYYMAVLMTAIFVMHPFLLMVSFLGAGMYLVCLKHLDGIKIILYMMPVFFVTSLINPLFSHRGMTVLCYLPTGNPVTLESVLYGFTTGLMFVTVILWFASFNIIFTNDKILWLVGKRFSIMGVLLSLTLRFVPKLSGHAKKIFAAQKAIRGTVYHEKQYESGSGVVLKNKGKKKDKMSIRDGFNDGMETFAALSGWALESSVTTADSMRARGYGIGKRSFYVEHRFEMRDIVALIVYAVCMLTFLVGVFSRTLGCDFYPMIEIRENSADIKEVFVVYAAYIMMCMFPTILSVREEVRWFRLRSKI